jgi:Cof subfamily protein (haloacid dehalogenase superfamily)
LIIKNQYKLLVLDIDGTILDKHGNISETDFRALQEIRRSGIGISLCTGRAAGSCTQILGKLSLGGLHIFCDGALVCDSSQKTEIYVKPISEEILRLICIKASDYHLPIELYSSTNLYIENETWISDIQRNFFGIYPRVVKFDSIFTRQRIIKAGLIVSSPEEDDRARSLGEELKDELYFSWARTPAYPGMSFINITTLGVSKGEALEILAAHLKIGLEDVMAFGDGSNDISLLKKAGFSVAMENAPDELKSVADFITSNVEQSGVARALSKFLL